MESVEGDESEEEEEGRKRRRSDSYSLTFDDSLSWCVIGGLGSGRDRHSSQSSDSHSTVRNTHTRFDQCVYCVTYDVKSECVCVCLCVQSEASVAATYSDSDNFSVEFEVESVASDDYNEDDASLSADDQVAQR